MRWLEALTYLRKQYTAEKERVQWNRTIGQIIQHRRFQSLFQPILDVKRGTTAGHELLNRPHPAPGIASTEQFYERLGASGSLFPFERTARAAGLMTYHRALRGTGRLLFINVHPNVLEDEQYARGCTRQLLEAYGMDPSQVVFEITEKQAVRDYGQLKSVVENYRSQGFRIAMDDVGAGYNSIKTLLALKPEYVKLDRVLTQGIDDAPIQQKLVTLFMEAAAEMEAEVIAEGVETEAEYAMLKKLNVPYMQGYYFAYPEEAPTFPEKVLTGSRAAFEKKTAAR
ncbi:EAL domain-containing protein [Alkalicoccus urumqiensis]|uniref:EAL domain-containing protein n=1 Tax=Alkalicoccus urumqiensis TaxID=1548213 RepID=A0A2P6MJ92_ALKUR|nr:EAL domain-containing protein [Alkalicoccus urumqiensis]PRO66352.1 EAL domain-containing protein [Alkalicoccus urumqiensis]